MSLTSFQSRPAIEGAFYRPNETLYQLQSSFHTQSTEPEPTARARRAEDSWARSSTTAAIGLRRRVGGGRPEGIVVSGRRYRRFRVRDVAEASGRILRRLSFRRRVAFVGRAGRIWARAGRGGGGALARPLLRRALVLHLWYKPLCEFRVPRSAGAATFNPPPSSQTRFILAPIRASLLKYPAHGE